MIENISSKGAYFCLDSGVAVGSPMNIIIEIPGEAGGGKKMRLCLKGIAVRLEEGLKRGKHQGVAVRFNKEYKFIPAGIAD